MLDWHGLPIRPVTYAQIDAHLEGHMFYPESQLVQTFGGPDISNGPDGGTSSAFKGAILSSTTGPDTIYSWYQERLQRQGWTTRQISNSSTWLSAHGYERNSREIFIVAVDDPSALQTTLGHPVPQHGTVFEISYSITPAAH